MSNKLKENDAKYYGSPAGNFVRQLAIKSKTDIAKDHEEIVKNMNEKFQLQTADGQVKRVVESFALYILTGYYSVDFGIFPHTRQQIEESIYNMSERWLTARGGKHAMEDRIDDDISSYLTHHKALLQEVNVIGNVLIPKEQMNEYKIPNILGYINDDNNKPNIDYYVNKQTFSEICKSLRIGTTVAKAELKRKGILQPENDGTGNTRVIVDKKQLRMMVLSYPHAPDSYSN
jgi:hypothetical protein